MKNVIYVMAVVLFCSCNKKGDPSYQSFNGANVTSNIENLGNIKDMVPTAHHVYSKPYGRNVWDMQVFENRIYFGYGSWANSSTSGATNTGVMPILAVDMQTDKLVREEVYCLDRNGVLTHRAQGAEDEQLWQFKEINGKLYAPGCDSRGTFDTGGNEWEWGNIYVRQDNGDWLKKRTVPGGIHVLNIAGYNGKLYVATGSNSDVPGSYSVMSSDDGGNTWKAPNNFSLRGGRFYTLFNWKDKLFAHYGGTSGRFSVYAIDKTNTASQDPYGYGNLTPAPGNSGRWIIKRHADVGNIFAFAIFHLITGGDSQYDIPGGLYYTTDFYRDAVIEKAVYPEPEAEPMDILSRDSFAYILTNVKNANDYTIIVYQTSDFTEFKKCFSFNYGSFARSFEENKGSFYIGIGADDVASPSELAGTIIKVPFEACH